MRRNDWSSGSADAERRGAAVRRLLATTGYGIGRHRVLDIGCGEGGVLRGYCATGGAVGIGSELDHRLVERGERARDAQYAFVNADARALPFTDASFDVVILYDVLEHVDGWPKAIREASRVLRSSGAVFVTAVNRRSPITVLDDPHWHLPLIAILPQRASAWITSRLDAEGLDMGGEHPAFPSWSQLRAGFRSAGLRPMLIPHLHKVVDPDGVVNPRRRRIARALREHGLVERSRRAPLRQVFAAYDRYFARSWTFVVSKATR